MPTGTSKHPARLRFCAALSAEHSYRQFMRSVGIADSPHSRGTPERVARMFREFTEGLREPTFQFTVFPKKAGHTYNQLVILQGIPFASLCAHHHVVFTGLCHVGYLPKEHIVGLSKIVRAVRWITRKPSIQEDLTEEIADFLTAKLKPNAVCVLVEAEHHCISHRGVNTPGVRTITHCIRGDKGLKLKDEFLTLIGKH